MGSNSSERSVTPTGVEVIANTIRFHALGGSLLKPALRLSTKLRLSISVNRDCLLTEPNGDPATA
jgi:hypothetical protein